jgi:hypothetical protein
MLQVEIKCGKEVIILIMKNRRRTSPMFLVMQKVVRLSMELYNNTNESSSIQIMWKEIERKIKLKK